MTRSAKQLGRPAVSKHGSGQVIRLPVGVRQIAGNHSRVRMQLPGLPEIGAGGQLLESDLKTEHWVGAPLLGGASVVNPQGTNASWVLHFSCSVIASYRPKLPQEHGPRQLKQENT